jgi:hypothetical protein
MNCLKALSCRLGVEQVESKSVIGSIGLVKIKARLRKSKRQHENAQLKLRH